MCARACVRQGARGFGRKSMYVERTSWFVEFDRLGLEGLVSTVRFNPEAGGALWISDIPVARTTTTTQINTAKRAVIGIIHVWIRSLWRRCAFSCTWRQSPMAVKKLRFTVPLVLLGSIITD